MELGRPGAGRVRRDEACTGHVDRKEPLEVAALAGMVGLACASDPGTEVLLKADTEVLLVQGTGALVPGTEVLVVPGIEVPVVPGTGVLVPGTWVLVVPGIGVPLVQGTVVVDTSGTLALAGRGTVLRIGLGSVEHDQPDSPKLVVPGSVELVKLDRPG